MIRIGQLFYHKLRVLSIKKILNLIITECQIRLKSERLRYLPPRVTIETGNICNLRCPLCPTGQKNPDPKRGLIRFSDFNKIVDEIGGHLLLIRLYNWGEPLLNKDLVSMIDYAVKKRITVNISTNLNTIDEEIGEKLLKAFPYKIFVSCDGTSAQTYSRYHVGGNFSTVIHNMKMLARLKKGTRNYYTRIIWLFHVFNHNQHEIEIAKKMAREIGVEIHINPMRTDMGKEIFETAAQAIDRDRDWIPDDPKYCPFNLETKTVRKEKTFCELPWKELVINWEGSVLPCCSVFEEKYSFGNAFTEGIRTIWNNTLYRSARKEIASKGSGPKTICHVCKSTGFTHF